MLETVLRLLFIVLVSTLTISPGSPSSGVMTADANIVYQGDSNMNYPNDTETSLPLVIAGVAPFIGHFHLDRGGPGQRIAETDSVYYRDPYPYRPAAQGGKQCWYVVAIGENNLRRYLEPTDLTAASFNNSTTITIAYPSAQFISIGCVLSHANIPAGATVLSVSHNTPFDFYGDTLLTISAPTTGGSFTNQTIGVTYPFTAAQILAELELLWSRPRADGIKTCIFTIPPSSTYGPTNDAVRLDVNDRIRRDSDKYDLLVDIAAVMDTNYAFGNYAMWKEGSGGYLHFNLRGRQEIAKMMAIQFLGGNGFAMLTKP